MANPYYTNPYYTCYNTYYETYSEHAIVAEDNTGLIFTYGEDGLGKGVEKGWKRGRTTLTC